MITAAAEPIKQQAAVSLATLAAPRLDRSALKYWIFPRNLLLLYLACFLVGKMYNSAPGANAQRRRRPSCLLLIT
jgi:hypothetical protein